MTPMQILIDTYTPTEDETEAAIVEAARNVHEGLCPDGAVRAALEAVHDALTSDAPELLERLELQAVDAWQSWCKTIA